MDWCQLVVGEETREDGDLRVVADGESPVMMALTVASEIHIGGGGGAGLELMCAHKEVGRRELVAACD